MNIIFYMLIFAVFLLFIVFFRDLFPRCSLCGRTVFLTQLKKFYPPAIYYNSPKVCKSCCKAYEIDAPGRVKQVEQTKRKVKTRVRSGKGY